MKNNNQIFNLPNTLSMFRIVAIPLLIVLTTTPGKYWGIAAAACFLLASITDFFDGYLARKLGVVTNLGRFLDPVADKLMVSAALIMLVGLDRAPGWVVFLIIGREITVTGLRAAAAASADKVVISAGWWGKVKVGFQIGAIIAMLLNDTYFGFNFGFWGLVALYVAMILTLWSGWIYFKQYWELIILGSDEY